VDSNGNSPYLVGPKFLRKILHRSAQSKIRELAHARDIHRELDAKIRLLDVPKRGALHQEELKSLKLKKLRMKETILRLTNEMQLFEVDNSAEKEKNTVLETLELGAGGFGRVLFGKCIKTGVEVAIKISPLDDFRSLWKEVISMYFHLSKYSYRVHICICTTI
jgi:hypothetical protein